MQLDVHHYIHFEDSKTNKKLDAILEKLAGLQKEGEVMIKEMQDLLAQVTVTEGALDSMKVYLDGLPAVIQAQIDAAAGDPAMLANVGATLKEKTDATMAALSANQPATP